MPDKEDDVLSRSRFLEAIVGRFDKSRCVSAGGRRSLEDGWLPWEGGCRLSMR